VEIHTRTLEDNFRFLDGLAAPHAELLAIVKANAYGHSLELCAPAAVRGGARWLGVTSVEEGVAARAVCPGAAILVIGGVFPGQGAEVVRHGLTVVAWEPWQLDELEQAAQSAGAQVPIHLEVDTGMSRQGIAPGHMGTLLGRFGSGSPMKLDGVMTHLLAADEANGLITAEQLEQMRGVLAKVAVAGLKPAWCNVGNSAALLAGQAEAIGAMAAAHGMRALLRPGLALYGLAPEYDPAFEAEPATLTEARQSLRPVLEWKSRVVTVREVPAGALVGYNGTFVATEPMRLALLAVGYADGLDRRLGNHFSLLVRGQRAPLVGRVSMDQAVVDVTEIAGVMPGDEVVLIGAQGDANVTAADHARAVGTIPWEIFTRIGPRVARVAV
jgi:alanine racemase